MSSSSTDSGASPPPQLEDDHELVKPVSDLVKPGHPAQKASSMSAPLIIAAYRHGDPYHKRRVKVPTHVTWREFLGLLCSRLEVSRDCDIGIYDENGIEIVSVEDLVPNDVLVVREQRKAKLTDYSQFGQNPTRGVCTRPMDDRGQNTSLRRSEETPHQHTTYTVATTSRSRLHDHFPPAGTPLLTHFIKANNFGYYFLAEVESSRLGSSAREEGGGKTGGKRAHCVVKVPSCDRSSDFSRIFEMEGTLLRKVSGHRSVITTPNVQILNFANEFLQLFFSRLPEHKQPPLTELFFSGTCSEAYIYPLYGVTMATKIKCGLSPEKAVRYAYQLADTMYFLQQRGVIHQTLLPENIQVMSNDRVMVCNFETAVQTDPTTCTLLISRSVVAPSNRMGLSPEVLNSFNREDAEIIDYSTQYPWSFGSLSVVMATGQHPLKNYPGRYMGDGKVKYRSHNYQSHPDINKYPSLFCRLVKRSLSCDPLRRPSLFQITSIMKKDSRTLTMMSSSTRGKGSVVSSPGVGPKCSHHRESIREHMEPERSGEQGTEAAYAHPRHRQHLVTSAQPSSNPANSTPPSHDQSIPSKRTKTELQSPFVDEYQHFPGHGRQQDVPQWPSSHDSHVTSYQKPCDSHDSPYIQRAHPEQRQFNQSYEGGRNNPNHSVLNTGHSDRGRESWSDVGKASSHRVPRAPSERGALNPRPPPVSGLAVSQHRRGSLGGFSDDFAPLGPSSSSTRTTGDITQSQSSVRYLEVAQALQEQRMSRKRSSATSDSDGNGTLGTEYQALLPEDSQDELLTNQTETENREPQLDQLQERLLREEFAPPPFRSVQTVPCPSSHHEDPPRSNSAQELHLGLRRPQQRIKSYEASRRSLRRPLEQVEFHRVSSLQQSARSNESSLVSSLTSRRCHSDSEAKVGSREVHAGSLHSNPVPPVRSYSNSSRVSPQTILSWNTFTRTAVKSGSRCTRDSHPSPISARTQEPLGGEGLQEEDAHKSVNDIDSQRTREGGEPMQTSPVTTHAFEVSDKLSDVSTNAQVGGTTTGVPSTGTMHQQALLSAAVCMTAGSEVRGLAPGTDQNVQNWGEQFGNDVGIHPLGGDRELQMECEIHNRGSGSDGYQGSTDFMLGVASSHGSNAELRQQFGLQSTASAPQQAAVGGARQQISDEPHAVNQQWSVDGQQMEQAKTTPEFQQPNIVHNPAVTTMYSGPHIMSPIAEVSQEFSTQQTAPQTFSASQTQHTQFTQSMHSLSPLPEQTTESDRNDPRRSTSPFRHNALGDAVTTALSPDAVSNHTNTSITSQVARVTDRSQTPQLEPPSTSSDTSRSLTRSSEVDISAQATLLPQVREDSGLNSFVGRGITSTDPVNTTTPQLPLQSVPQGAVDMTERSSQVTPTPNANDAAFPAANQSQKGPIDDSTRSTRGNSSRGHFAGSGAFQSPRTYQSTEGNRERRGQDSTPWSTTSAPLGYGSHSRHHRRVQRSGSPGSSTTPSALSDSVAVQFRAARTTNQDQSGTMSQRSLGRRRHKGSCGTAGGGARHHHTAAHRISQDLEMMTRAIEGMDSQNAEGDRRAALTREERLQMNSSHPPSPSRAQPAGNRGAYSLTRGAPNRYHSNTDTRLPFAPATDGRSSSVEPSPSHQNASRMNTVSVPLDSRGRQARGNTDAGNYDFHHTQNMHNSLPGLSQIPPNDDSPDPIRHASLELGTPNLAQSGTPPTQAERGVLSPVQFPSAMPVEDDRAASRRVPVVPPPQAGTDSYDYLPPYSPPRPVEYPGNQVSTAVVQQAQQVYHEPPPSYEEIFGQQNGGRQRQRQRRPSQQSRSRQEEDRVQGGESQSQTDRSSHRTGSRTSGHRKLPSLTSLFKRSRRHSRDLHLSHRSNRAQHREQVTSSSPVPDNQVALSPSGASETDYQAGSPEPSTLQRTASWVASYSQTPRPITAYQHLRFRDFRGRDNSSSVSAAGTTVHSSTHYSRVSRAVSDTAAMTMHVDTSSHSQPTNMHHQTAMDAGLPSYRHPPPFLLTPQDPAMLSERQASYTTSPQDSNTLSRRQTSYSNNLQDPNMHSRSQTSYASTHPLPVRPHSRPRDVPLNLSQPNISTLSPSHGNPSSVNTPNSSHQAPAFRRVLAHPPRTRPISSLVTSAEYGRVGGSMTSVVSPHSVPSEPVLTSAIERLRSDERDLDRSGAGSNDREDQLVSREVHNEQPSRRSYLPWQQRGSSGSLSANGNANNVNPSPASPQGQSPNATPMSSPVVRRRVLSAEGEQNPDYTQQSQTQTVENGASQNGIGTSVGGSREGGGDSNLQHSTPRSRAVSRRLAEQPSSSEEDLVGASSSASSHGRTRHRRKRGDGSSRTSSRQGSQSQNSPFTSPLDPQTPVFFPSFQSQTTDLLPDDGIFSAVSNDLTLQSTVNQDVSVSHESHVMSQCQSHDNHVMSQHQSQDQQIIVMSPGPHSMSQPLQQPARNESHDHPTIPTEMSHDHAITSPSELSNQGVTTPDVSHDQPTPTQNESHDQGGDVTALEICSNSARERDSATPGTSGTHSVTDSLTPTHHTSKPCGHVCVAVQLEVCCECMHTRQSLDDITDLFQNCEICESRRSLGQDCNCVSNKINNSCPIHGGRGHQRSLIGAPHASHHNRKHCIVM